MIHLFFKYTQKLIKNQSFHKYALSGSVVILMMWIRHLVVKMIEIDIRHVQDDNSKHKNIVNQSNLILNNGHHLVHSLGNYI